MRKVLIGTTGAIALVLAGTLAWNAEAKLICTYPQCMVCVIGTLECKGHLKGIPPNPCPPVHCVKKPRK